MRRPIREIERDRDALSLRGIERVYGYSREFVGPLARAGAIPATRRGRALVILRSDFEQWMRAHAVGSHSSARAEALAERMLRREAGETATP